MAPGFTLSLTAPRRPATVTAFSLALSPPLSLSLALHRRQYFTDARVVKIL